MTDRRLEPELEAFLETRRIERRAPPQVRARALARARAIIAAGGRIPRSSSPAYFAPLPRPPGSARRVLRTALAATLAVAAGAAVAGAALMTRAVADPPRDESPVSRPRPAAVIHDEGDWDVSGEPPTRVVRPRAGVARPTRPARASGDGAAFKAELELLAHAQAAYTRRDFGRALILIDEHARRFSRGHLAEEREALRVRSLAGSGRTDEARRIAATFAVRFPRSVLLSRVDGADH